ncbi:hypothetical protein PENDEC_c016G01355 [Penicillium decumbens]|uniref:Uncharacterized protein n=1 Tax=Penicillium decumbens TaxID=69771 RepID=A0A1V6P8S6_PENDC|nr:hypothetical protein PENDEC_c016G01355 [Penicillium decumbens]
MKSFFALAAFAGVALAQSAQIGLPTTGQNLVKGGDVIVQVQRPNSLTGSTEMAVAIGISSCASTTCNQADEVMGSILYNGKFNPQYHEYYQPPYQNFSVKIPADFTSGTAQINVAHATLIGAGPFPFLEALNRTVIVV